MKKIFFAIFMVLLIMSCDKEPRPVPVVIEPKLEVVVEEVSKTSAKASIKVEAGSYKIQSSGICYSQNGNPTTEDKKVSGSGTINLVNLEIGTKYFLRAYAIAEGKTFYSQQVELTTGELVVTLKIANTGKTSASMTLGVDENVSSITSSGIYYSKNPNPTVSDTKVSGMGNLELKNLELNTKYYAKGYVLTATSSHYSQVQEFTTEDLVVSLTVSSVSKTTASLKVEVDENISAINGAGICYSKNPNPTVSDTKVSGMGNLELKNLEINTKYYAKGYVLTATSSHYSQVQEFATEDLIISLAISNVDKRGATATFQADESLPGVLESGICYSKVNEVPTEADKKASGPNSVKLELLSYETKYFVRAYIKTASKTYYSPVQNFTTIKLPTVKDYDGNVYRIIEMPSTAGLTYWLLDNFKGTHFANGDPIPNITDNTAWTQQTGPAYCHYDNDPKNTETYGALYNWYVASDPRGLIAGWQAPTDKQWLEMTDSLPMTGNPIGGFLKEEGFSHWKEPNTDAHNKTGFTALPGGTRGYETGTFYYLKEVTYFITYDNFGDSYWSRKLLYNEKQFGEPGVDILIGASIRLRKK